MADRHIIYISFTTKNEKQSITSPFSSKAFAWWVAYTISSFQLSNPSITSPLLIKTNWKILAIDFILWLNESSSSYKIWMIPLTNCVNFVTWLGDQLINGTCRHVITVSPEIHEIECCWGIINSSNGINRMQLLGKSRWEFIKYSFKEKNKSRFRHRKKLRLKKKRKKTRCRPRKKVRKKRENMPTTKKKSSFKILLFSFKNAFLR